MKLAEAKVGGVFDGHLMVESFQTGKTARGKLYANFSLKDTDQTVIKGVFWDYQETDGDFIQPGKVIKLIGARIGEYNGAKQLTVEAYMPSDVPPTDFMKATRFRVSEMEAQVMRTINSFKDPKVILLSKNLLQEPVLTSFIKAPAATGVHNNWAGGLIEHVCSMLTIAEPICQHYTQKYAPYFNRDVLLFGVIFHDLGKILEYDVNNPAFERTQAGHYVNHIVMGPAWIYHKGKEVGMDSYQIMELMHVISSHHGCYEWGSPTKPATLEAILLHHLDNMDSKFMHAWDLMENLAECSGGLTKKSWVEGTKYISQKEKTCEGESPRSGAQYGIDWGSEKPSATGPYPNPETAKPVELRGDSGHDAAAPQNSPKDGDVW